MDNQTLITPPRDFLLKNIRENDNDYKNGDIWIDNCLVSEIKDLWNKGIKTTGCCCGHNKGLPRYIGVEKENEKDMLSLGYVKFVNEFGAVEFLPKSECKCEVEDNG